MLTPRCVPKRGREERSRGYGHLYVRGERGPIALVEVNPERYIEKGQFAQPERSKQNAWAHPVIAGGRMYLRDQGILLCYDVKRDGQ